MASFAQQVKSDFSKLTRTVGYAIAGKTDPKMKDPRYRPTLNDTKRNKRAASMLKDMQAQNEHSNKMSARSRGGGGSKGPTVADQVAARAAAKLKAKKAKGQARRKKYEAAGSMAKKMKLIFVD